MENKFNYWAMGNVLLITMGALAADMTGIQSTMAMRTCAPWTNEVSVASCPAAVQSRAEVAWTRVIADDGGRYCGWPSVCCRKNGELIAVYSGDRTTHICPWGQVRLIRSTDNGETWSEPQVIRNGLLDDRDAGIIELDNGDLMVFWFTSIAYKVKLRKRNPDWDRHYAKIPEKLVREELGSFSMNSSDGGKTWSKPVRVPTSAPHGGIQLQDGRIVVVGVQNRAVRGNLLPEDPGEAAIMPSDRYVVAESRDRGASWRELGVYPVGEYKAICEPHLFEAKDGVLHAFFRNHKGNGCLTKSCSRDGGKTWSDMQPTAIDGFPPHILRLRDGRLVLSYGRRKTDRFGEFAVISDDGGKTWDVAHEVALAHSINTDLGYPCSTELLDGSILTVYYQQPVPGPGAKPAVMATKWKLTR